MGVADATIGCVVAPAIWIVEAGGIGHKSRRRLSVVRHSLEGMSEDTARPVLDPVVLDRPDARSLGGRQAGHLDPAGHPSCPAR